jgi:hypothetical protein
MFNVVASAIALIIIRILVKALGPQSNHYSFANYCEGDSSRTPQYQNFLCDMPIIVHNSLGFNLMNRSSTELLTPEAYS